MLPPSSFYAQLTTYAGRSASSGGPLAPAWSAFARPDGEALRRELLHARKAESGRGFVACARRESVEHRLQRLQLYISGLEVEGGHFVDAPAGGPWAFGPFYGGPGWHPGWPGERER
eukprot:tig00000900_g5380.t1